MTHESSACSLGTDIPRGKLMKCLLALQIHRSKNRWKFYLKDGVMCYGGKDYVFSKAVGEAEW